MGLPFSQFSVDGEHATGIGRFGRGSRQLLTNIYKISIVYNVKD